MAYDDDDEAHESEDDVLEESRAGGSSMFHPDTDEDTLPEDGPPPSAPLHGDYTGVNPQDPQTDDKLDEDEVYSEGLAAAEDKEDDDSDDEPLRPLELESEDEKK